MDPFEIGLLVFGLILGPFLNFAIYSFAYFPRPISPWQRPPSEFSSRHRMSGVPVVGWLCRRNEATLFGRLYWIRPLVIELVTPVALVLMYRFVMGGGIVPQGGIGMVSAATHFHQFIACTLLTSLMVIATFIDFDERTIPDLITIPGTLLGLLGSVIFPDWRLYELSFPVPPALVGNLQAVHANSPFDWNLAWNPGAAGNNGLWIGLLCWSGWCFGMADRRWIVRRGFTKAVVYFIEGLRRNPGSRMLLVLWIVGLVLLTIAYWTIGATRWEALLSSLFGIGLGGLLVWGFRLVARWAMGQEALGFGDVTLMAMIGSFFGWQIVWISFFLAPFFGLLFVVIVWVLTRDNATPFGPYLCAAALYAILDWNNLWEWSSNWFLPPHLVLIVLVVLLSALGGMLWCVQRLKMILFGRDSPGARA
ncbi:MAG: A24 family peptidase [Pirellula sp.]